MCQAFTYMATYISPNPACYASGDMLLKRAQQPLRAPEATTAAAMAALSWIFWRGRHQAGTCAHPAGFEAAWSRV